MQFLNPTLHRPKTSFLINFGRHNQELCGHHTKAIICIDCVKSPQSKEEFSEKIRKAVLLNLTIARKHSSPVWDHCPWQREESAHTCFLLPRVLAPGSWRARETNPEDLKFSLSELCLSLDNHPPKAVFDQRKQATYSALKRMFCLLL